MVSITKQAVGLDCSFLFRLWSVFNNLNFDKVKFNCVLPLDCSDTGVTEIAKLLPLGLWADFVAVKQGFSTGGPWPLGGPRRHCRWSATWAYVDQFTIDFLFIFMNSLWYFNTFQDYTWISWKISKKLHWQVLQAEYVRGGGGVATAVSDLPW